MIICSVKMVQVDFLAAGLISCGFGVAGWMGVAQSKDAKEGRKEARGAGAGGTTLLRTIRFKERVGAFAWSPDGKLLVTQADRYKRNPNGPDFEIEASTVKVWDAESGEEKVSLGEVTDPRFRLLAFASVGNSILHINHLHIRPDLKTRDRAQEIESYNLRAGENWPPKRMLRALHEAVEPMRD